MHATDTTDAHCINDKHRRGEGPRCSFDRSKKKKHAARTQMDLHCSASDRGNEKIIECTRSISRGGWRT
ncbi:hypothetical protein WN55_09716 [Dufourea novaeangliae]|uniref:Uncharacterized protein n=1 Tax=Dufourea novaeangliae TaxID=178035 RepID=A0A154NZ62_DUFNO|nr:hypothetical protein WN55_09716 [Dufourea novaeangliae]